MCLRPIHRVIADEAEGACNCFQSIYAIPLQISPVTDVIGYYSGYDECNDTYSEGISI